MHMDSSYGLSAALSAVPAVPISHCGQPISLGGAGRDDGQQWGLLQETLSVCKDSQALHRGQSPTGGAASQPNGHQACVPGRPSSDWNVGGQSQPRCQSANPSSSGSRSTDRSRGHSGQGQSGRSRAIPDRTTRRPSYVESRPSSTSSLVARRDCPQGHRRGHQGKDQTDLGGHEAHLGETESLAQGKVGVDSNSYSGGTRNSKHWSGDFNGKFLSLKLASGSHHGPVEAADGCAGASFSRNARPSVSTCDDHGNECTAHGRGDGSRSTAAVQCSGRRGSTHHSRDGSSLSTSITERHPHRFTSGGGQPPADGGRTRWIDDQQEVNR